jgi:hypothetical protein
MGGPTWKDRALKLLATMSFLIFVTGIVTMILLGL